MRLRLATFNLENLFSRFDYSAFTDEYGQRYLPPIMKFYNELEGDLSNFETYKNLMQSTFISQEDDKRQHTALAFSATNADIYGLQEIDNYEALKKFFDFYVKKVGVKKYNQLVVYEGNDRRGIDVGAIARDIRPIMSRSHAHITGAWVDDTAKGKALLEKYPEASKKLKSLKGERIFRRDCIELETKLGNQTVTIYVCHFKSMGGGRKKTVGMRQLEAIAVRELISRKFPEPEQANWIIMGDLNDYRLKISIGSEQNSDGTYDENVTKLLPTDSSGIDPLLDANFGFNTLELLPEGERWTHYYASKRHKTQLDYIIASPEMKKKIKGKPEVIRNGMPFRVPNTDNIQRYPRVGWDRPKASDHCPIVVEFDI